MPRHALAVESRVRCHYPPLAHSQCTMGDSKRRHSPDGFLMAAGESEPEPALLEADEPVLPDDDVVQ